MKKGQIFPIAANESFLLIPEKRKFKVQTTGEFRKPKKGEFFISGAIPEAYLAPNNLNVPYYIGRLVVLKEIQKEVVVKDHQFLCRKLFEIQICEL